MAAPPDISLFSEASAAMTSPVVFITGASAGLGVHFARQLSATGARLGGKHRDEGTGLVGFFA